MSYYVIADESISIRRPAMHFSVRSAGPDSTRKTDDDVKTDGMLLH